MATTTKSTKAKTKTTKPKTTKTAKPKTASAKTQKTTTKKAVQKPAKASAVSSVTSNGMLQKLYALSIAAYVAIFGAALFLMGQKSYQLSIGYWTRDELASKTSTVFAPATQGLIDVQMRWVVMAIAVVSIVMPVLYLTRLKSYHQKAMKNKVLPTRWLDMAIVGAIMLETVAIVSGVLDIGTLKLVGGLMIVTCILGWMAEKRTAEAGRPATAKYYLSMLTGLLPWVLIAFYAIATPIYGAVRSPWYVYALYAVMLIGAGLIGNNQLKGLKGKGKQANYEVVEQNYATLSLLVRTAFAVVLIVGLMAK